jgi:hypothetical protein
MASINNFYNKYKEVDRIKEIRGIPNGMILYFYVVFHILFVK